MLNVPCSDTEIFLLLYPAGLCACAFSLPLTSSLEACYRLFHSLIFVVCVCFLASRGKLTEELLRWASAVLSGDSRCEQSRMWANSQDWSPSLSHWPLPLSVLTFLSILHAPFLALFVKESSIWLTTCSVSISSKRFLLLYFMHHEALSVWPCLTSFCIYFSLAYLCPLWRNTVCFIISADNSLWCWSHPHSTAISLAKQTDSWPNVPWEYTSGSCWMQLKKNSDTFKYKKVFQNVVSYFIKCH